MKTVKIVLTAVVLLLATNAVSAQVQKTNTRNKDAEVVFSVNIHCDKCEQKIKKNIPFEKGVKGLTTDLDKQLVTIKYQTDKTDKDKLKKSIEKLGYTCKEVEGQGK